MSPLQRKRANQTDYALAAAMFGAGLTLSAFAFAQISTQHGQLAQATPPLQSTPGAESRPSAPPSPTSSDARPGPVSPQPARPDAEAQQSGATPALPPAPAEKTGEPLRPRT